MATANGEHQDPYIPFVLHRPKIAILSPPHESRITPPSSTEAIAALALALCSLRRAALPELFVPSKAVRLNELIAAAASAENQFLNLISERIHVALGRYRGIGALAIDNLQYFTTLLKHLIERTE
ncbi:hypothetical protein ACHAPT_009891 [Fusarium lateritium]